MDVKNIGKFILIIYNCILLGGKYEIKKMIKIPGLHHSDIHTYRAKRVC